MSPSIVCVSASTPELSRREMVEAWCSAESRPIVERMNRDVAMYPRLTHS